MAEDQPVTVRIEDLLPGARIVGVSRLSSEYSYLDSRTLEQLKTRFKGAKARVVRGGRKHQVDIDALERGDQLDAITDLPPGSEFAAASAETVQFLKSWGCREMLVVEPAPAASRPAKAAAVPGRTAPAVPRFASATAPEHKARVAEARRFLEQVEQADGMRGEAAEMVEELFHQGRVSRFSAQPAVEMVEQVISADAGSAMAAIVGLKASDQTYSHCVDMAVILCEAARELLAGKDAAADKMIARSTLAAGFMHDIGKCRIPREILDSTERFDPDGPEMALIRSHVTHSAQILADAGMNDAMINVAHYHHVKVDTSLANSYPAVDYAKVIPLTRLASIVDVYQALIGRRSYKRNWVPGKAVALLRQLKGTEFDERILAAFLKQIGLYPVGSLVRLSTGDVGFVTKVTGHDPERPVVVIAENVQGERLSSNPLVDLMAEQDVYVTEVVDHYAHYAEHPNQAFQIFKGLQVA